MAGPETEIVGLAGAAGFAAAAGIGAAGFPRPIVGRFSGLRGRCGMEVPGADGRPVEAEDCGTTGLTGTAAGNAGFTGRGAGTTNFGMAGGWPGTCAAVVAVQLARAVADTPSRNQDADAIALFPVSAQLTVMLDITPGTAVYA